MNPLLILTLAAIGQHDGLQFTSRMNNDIRVSYTGLDYYFDQRVEDFAIDFAIDQALDKKQPALYTKHMPTEVREAVSLMYEDCEKCKRRGVADAVKLGRPAVRWLHWARRSVHSQVRANALVAIKQILRCTACNGTGYCQGFTPRDGVPTQCDSCRYYQYSHEDRFEDKCQWCESWGVCGKS